MAKDSYDAETLPQMTGILPNESPGDIYVQGIMADGNQSNTISGDFGSKPQHREPWWTILDHMEYYFCLVTQSIDHTCQHQNE